MSTTEDINISQISTVERVIFHIIGPDLKAPTILTEVEDPSVHSEFFISRLIETSQGTSYNFNPASGVHTQIQQALDSPHAFVDCSQILAERFQKLYESDKRLIPGVLMLLQIKSDDERYAAIIKYDDIKVISYKTHQTEDGKTKPILNLILNTFVQDKKALQKSALIKISGATGKLICIDRSEKNGDITEKFKAFLDVSREFTHETLTDRLLTAILNTAKSNKDIVSPAIISSLKTTAKEAISSIKVFNPEHPENLLAAMFGELHSDEKILSSFTKELKKQKIGTSIIKIPENHYPKPTKKIKETYEGVKVIYTQEHIDSGDIKFDDSENTKKIIVSTLQYIVDDEFNGKF
ncbi:nucleoid-associated protein [Pseudomonas syringae]|uniref:Nucleoid-associated protein n=1 Tax=Pseudomonas syringae pv. actinidiae ICMP 19096 TaxID=1194405 RepID=A0A656JML6_PSESF|nr:nucleoid-associated protein [Pseudomonas syringae]EPM51232.1 hypothetical protein A246_03190 [Pseudomonas syringae pv. actinidiae ICMP 19098]EPN37059.1 hypothetical protein A243_03747 [Pseudomonas syringae pv. actinidiae ICMP 18883]EPN38463.1 hypothetical protein A245_38544 [Pseudomonas syringae pv. actinidiae ICMP 19096]